MNMLQNNLFLTSNVDDKNKFIDYVNRAANTIADSYTDSRAYSGLTPQELKELIKETPLLPESGIGFDSVLEKVKRIVLPNLLKVSSTDYMAHLHSPPLMESLISELILATGNQSMDSWDQAPIATEIEVDVINQLCEIYNLPKDSDGIFTSGGTQSNLMGITMARDWFCNTKLDHDVKLLGLPQEYNKFRLYTSEVSHFSVEKSAHLLGLGYNSVIKVPVTNDQKMNTEILRDLIIKDLESGFLPVAIIGTVGTTDYGSIDDLETLSEICQEFGIWLHADAAYGSGLILSQTYKEKISHISKCDSITVDFHKMFLLPISCGAFFLKDKTNFSHLTLHADYLNREEDEEEGYTNLVGKSMQTTRRFDALKVWMLFQSLGKKSLSDTIDKTLNNANYFYKMVDSNPNFQVVTKPEISSVVFRYSTNKLSDDQVDTINKRIRRELIHRDGIVIGQTIFDGRVFLKLTLLNPLVEHKHLDNLINVILEKSNYN
ncbi:pyridoxal phosphate-dependent decarboxylase family protein [Thiospirochaeta perfilievii]|nr:aspartate aminotransferase family protein [Thiospirochaeta perfilievii]